jgi:hypothetical protein
VLELEYITTPNPSSLPLRPLSRAPSASFGTTGSASKTPGVLS